MGAGRPDGCGEAAEPTETTSASVPPGSFCPTGEGINRTTRPGASRPNHIHVTEHDRQGHSRTAILGEEGYGSRHTVSVPEPLVLRLPAEIAATPQQAQRRIVTVLVEIIHPLRPC